MTELLLFVCTTGGKRYIILVGLPTGSVYNKPTAWASFLRSLGFVGLFCVEMQGGLNLYTMNGGHAK
jgi:hypothetical protein